MQTTVPVDSFSSSSRLAATSIDGEKLRAAVSPKHKKLTIYFYRVYSSTDKQHEAVVLAALKSVVTNPNIEVIGVSGPESPPPTPISDGDGGSGIAVLWAHAFLPKLGHLMSGSVCNRFPRTTELTHKHTLCLTLRRYHYQLNRRQCEEEEDWSDRSGGGRVTFGKERNEEEEGRVGEKEGMVGEMEGMVGEEEESGLERERRKHEGDKIKPEGNDDSSNRGDGNCSRRGGVRRSRRSVNATQPLTFLLPEEADAWKNAAAAAGASSSSCWVLKPVRAGCGVGVRLVHSKDVPLEADAIVNPPVRLTPADYQEEKKKKMRLLLVEEERRVTFTGSGGGGDFSSSGRRSRFKEEEEDGGEPESQEVDNAANGETVRVGGEGSPGVTRSVGTGRLRQTSKKRDKRPGRVTYVAQLYIERPLLIHGFKVDLRLYVLVTNFPSSSSSPSSSSPSQVAGGNTVHREDDDDNDDGGDDDNNKGEPPYPPTSRPPAPTVYLFREGAVRFATQPYTMDPSQHGNPFVHLTNNCVNMVNYVNEQQHKDASLYLLGGGRGGVRGEEEEEPGTGKYKNQQKQKVQKDDLEVSRVRDAKDDFVVPSGKAGKHERRMRRKEVMIEMAGGVRAVARGDTESSNPSSLPDQASRALTEEDHSLPPLGTASGAAGMNWTLSQLASWLDDEKKGGGGNSGGNEEHQEMKKMKSSSPSFPVESSPSLSSPRFPGLWERICHLVAEPFAAVAPTVSAATAKTRTDFPSFKPATILDENNATHTTTTTPPPGGSSNFFELFGVDVMVDADLRPWLLEINSRPSLSGSLRQEGLLPALFRAVAHSAGPDSELGAAVSPSPSPAATAMVVPSSTSSLPAPVFQRLVL